MFINRYKSHVLIAASLLATACATLNPNHEGRYVFEGTVKTKEGIPVPNAWVKVRGWETMTDAKGKWRQEQIVHCGAKRESMGNYDENDTILIEAQGFESYEEKFVVKHPSWFASCKPDETLAFETVLQPLSGEKRAAKEATLPDRKEEKTIPWGGKSKKGKNVGKGAYEL